TALLCVEWVEAGNALSPVRRLESSHLTLFLRGNGEFKGRFVPQVFDMTMTETPFFAPLELVLLLLAGGPPRCVELSRSSHIRCCSYQFFSFAPSARAATPPDKYPYTY